MKLEHLLVILFFTKSTSNKDKSMNKKSAESDKKKFCEEVKDCVSAKGEVCGIRQEGERFHLKIFSDECELMQFSCNVKEDDAYGIINMEYCNPSYEEGDKGFAAAPVSNMTETPCSTYTCTDEVDKDYVCGIREQGAGFKIRLFVNECHLFKHNCLGEFKFQPTERHICDGLALPIESRRSLPSNSTNFTEVAAVTNLSVASEKDLLESGKLIDVDNATSTERLEYFGDNGVTITPVKRQKHLIIVDDASLYDVNGNVNDTINNFFSATHVFDLPLQDMRPMMNVSTRKRFIQNFGPVIVFKPWVRIPKNISYDVWHQPTLQTCFHKCPVECPQTYSPVCGSPGQGVRHPAVMFKNHCFMDVAQCKMRWENKSIESQISTYIESSFIFCLGDTLSSLYRFLPLVRTLQRMGRLKKKGRFHIQLRNMRFFNEMLRDTPKLMG